MDYSAAYPDPLILQAGETVYPTRWDDEWPGWTWCSNKAGKGGWVPEHYLDRGGHEVVCLYPYDGTELSFQKGERMLVENEVCGWYWCVNRYGQRGWVPSNRVQEE